MTHLAHKDGLDEIHLLQLMRDNKTNPVITDILERFVSKQVYQKRGIYATLFGTTRLRCTQQALLHVVSELAPYLGFLVTACFHLLIIHVIIFAHMAQDG